ncbi:unnamed protein product [Closterium sp. Naga37s-1]|nr:unnamed protein product [Closterium sp. Naga37s-1]
MRTLNLVIDTLARAGMTAEALQVRAQRVLSRVNKGTVGRGGGVGVGGVEEMRVLRSIPSWGLVASAHSYNLVLKLLSAAWKAGTCMQHPLSPSSPTLSPHLLPSHPRRLPSHPLPPPPTTSPSLTRPPSLPLTACEQLLDHMLACGVPPNLLSFNLVLGSLLHHTILSPATPVLPPPSPTPSPPLLTPCTAAPRPHAGVRSASQSALLQPRPRLAAPPHHTVPSRSALSPFPLLSPSPSPSPPLHLPHVRQLLDHMLACGVPPNLLSFNLVLGSLLQHTTQSQVALPSLHPTPSTPSNPSSTLSTPRNPSAHPAPSTAHPTLSDQSSSAQLPLTASLPDESRPPSLSQKPSPLPPAPPTLGCVPMPVHPDAMTYRTLLALLSRSGQHHRALLLQNLLLHPSSAAAPATAAHVTAAAADATAAASAAADATASDAAAAAAAAARVHVAPGRPESGSGDGEEPRGGARGARSGAGEGNGDRETEGNSLGGSRQQVQLQQGGQDQAQQGEQQQQQQQQRQWQRQWQQQREQVAGSGGLPLAVLELLLRD